MGIGVFYEPTVHSTETVDGKMAFIESLSTNQGKRTSAGSAFVGNAL